MVKRGLPMEPSREGARGGRDQFNWADVKAMPQNERDHYLGASVHALAGAWTKGKDVYWYTRDKAAEQQQEDELAFIKQREREMIDEALGIKPKEKVLPQGQLDKRELDQLMGKGAEAEAEGAAGFSNAEEHRGLGGRAPGTAGMTTGTRQFVADPSTVSRELPGPPADEPRPSGTSRGTDVSRPAGRSQEPAPSREDERQRRKAEKRERKEKKRAEKAMKREEKRRRKEERRRGAATSDSSSDSSGGSRGASPNGRGRGGRGGPSGDAGREAGAPGEGRGRGEKSGYRGGERGGWREGGRDGGSERGRERGRDERERGGDNRRREREWERGHERDRERSREARGRDDRRERELERGYERDRSRGGDRDWDRRGRA